MKKIKNILISGGNGRVGKSIADYFVSKNHNVVCGDKLFTQYKKKYPPKNLFVFESDLTKEKNIQNFINFALKKLGHIDVFLHCLYPKTNDWGNNLEKLKQSNLNKNLNDHLGSSIIFAKHLIKYFLKKKRGNLIFFSSIYGISSPNFEDYNKKVYSTVEYGAIKSGIISVTRYLAKCYKKKGLRINCLSPGGIEDNQEKRFISNYKKHCNTKGLLHSDDLNGLINFLISEDSKYINGQNIIIDDGWSL